MIHLEFAVLCEYAGYLPNGQFIVVAPAIHSISAERAVGSGSVSLAGALHVPSDDRSEHTLRIDATGPERLRFTVASEQRVEVQAGLPMSEIGTQRNFAVPVGAAFQSPGDYLLHVVIDGQDAKTLPMHVSPSSSEEFGAPSFSQIEAMHRSELEQWLELAKMTPSEQALQRIADRFVLPPEWFQEEDLFEPQAETE
jgi:hypothetical protein